MRSHFVGRRVSLAVLVSIVVALLFVLVSRVLSFVRIFSTHAGIELTQDEVNAAHNATTPDPRPQVVPKIIHQIFHNWKNPGDETIPADWDDKRKSCMDLHPDWTYYLWTESQSQYFIATEFPWFLETYDSYAFPVQRVDALRYFLMRHHGGIYIDLDNGCLANLEPLLYYPVFVTDGGHGALSNNILGAAPNHTFWQLLTDALPAYSWNYPLPYITISYASGQWFLTELWEQYHASLRHGGGLHASAVRAAASWSSGARGSSETSPDGTLYRIMMDMRDGAARWVFWDMGRGESWRNWDNDFFIWVGNHILLLVLMGGALVVAPAWLAMRIWARYKQYRARRSGGLYAPLGHEGHELLPGEERDNV